MAPHESCIAVRGASPQSHNKAAWPAYFLRFETYFASSERMVTWPLKPRHSVFDVMPVLIAMARPGVEGAC